MAHWQFIVAVFMQQFSLTGSLGIDVRLCHMAFVTTVEQPRCRQMVYLFFVIFLK